MQPSNMQTDMLLKAQQGKLIESATDQELSKALTKVYLIIGLRSQHYPNQLMDSLLFQYLRDCYGQRTLQELILAFELAIFGKLDVEDWKVYDMFSVEYLVRIMESYRRYKIKMLTENQKKPIEKMLPISKPTKEDMLRELNEWKSKELTINFIPLYLYDYMVECGLIENKLSQHILWKACMLRKNELHKAAMNGSREAINDHHAFNEMVEMGEIIGAEKTIVARIAKKIMVFEYLKK